MTTTITNKSIATLVVFIFSMIFVIHAVHIPVRIPFLGRRRIPINLTTAPIAAIVILCAAQCMGAREIRDGIVGTEGVKPYNILLLFFSLAYMAITLDVTGILKSAAYWVSNKGGADGWKVYFYFYVMLTLLSVLVGNDPVILSGTAFLVYYTKVVEELQPLPWLITEFAAANTASMVLFVGNPTNVVICEGFGVNNAAFTAYTILPFLACSIACLIALAIQYRSPKDLPRRITPTHLDARLALLDPVGAWFGSILLGSCLVVIIVVSFFKVDVWMISLPFAFAKFIWDLAWDHYRFITGMPMLGRGQTDVKEQVTPKRPLSPNGVVPSHDSVSQSPEKSLRNESSPISTDETLNGALGTHAEPAMEISKEQIPPVSPSPKSRLERLRKHFPTFFTALPRLPFALVPFAFSQFILIEALTGHGWIDVFALWLTRASKHQIYPTIWLIGVLGVILCNIAGTNIGATILLTKVVRAANMPPHSLRAAAIALAVASNIGAVSFTFSASLAGLLWRTILQQKGISVRQRDFAKCNIVPLAAMTTVGLSVVCAEMAVLYGGKVS